MHAAMLHTGKVLLNFSNNRTVLWDPDPAVPQHPSEIMTWPKVVLGLSRQPLYAVAILFLSDGRLLVRLELASGGPGEASSIQGWKFDPTTD